MGLALLWVALLGLSMALRSAQPGLLPSSPLTVLTGVGVLYVVCAVLLVHRPPAMAAAFGLMVATHAVSACVTGLAFAALDGQVQGTPDSILAVAWLGLGSYPPAAVIQAAFALAVGAVFMGPEPSRSQWAQSLRDAGVESSHSPRELARAIAACGGTCVAADEGAQLVTAAARRVLAADAPSSLGPVTLAPPRPPLSRPQPGAPPLPGDEKDRSEPPADQVTGGEAGDVPGTAANSAEPPIREQTDGGEGARQ